MARRKKFSKGLTLFLAIVCFISGAVAGFYGYFKATLPQESDVFVSGDLEIHFIELGNKYSGGSYPAPGGFFPSPKAPAGWLRGHIENMYRYLECVNSGTTPSPSFKDGALVSAVMDAALRSDATGRDCPVIWEDAE